MKKRLLILCTTTGYQTRAFGEAAAQLGLEAVLGSDRCHMLEDPWEDGALPLRFEDPEESAGKIVDFACSSPIAGIVAVGDRPVPTAARAARALNLPCHPPEAADNCRDKYRSRSRLGAAGLNVPAFARWPLESDPQAILAARGPGEGDFPGFPCVLKPLALSGSRGVIRADTPMEFEQAFQRIRSLLRTPEVRVLREETSGFIQVESYVGGGEIAVEAVVDRGRLQILAVFEKPDPLRGPFFEESIYVTPPRLRPEILSTVKETLERATRALGLSHGPLHAEMRLNARGAWILEVAARPIGGLCSRVLRFNSPVQGETVSLEELIIRLSLGREVDSMSRERAASGVMMIPIPSEGVFERSEGVEDAAKTPGVEEILITAKPGQKLVPLPEGSSYLGFIFARGASPDFVEFALRAAHAQLRFEIQPALALI